MAQIAKIAIEAATYAIDKPYSYQVPDGMNVSAGLRVMVPFGRGNRRSEGMVLAVESGQPERRLKAVLSVRHRSFPTGRSVWHCGCVSDISARFTMRSTLFCPLGCGMSTGKYGR